MSASNSNRFVSAFVSALVSAFAAGLLACMLVAGAAFAEEPAALESATQSADQCAVPNADGRAEGDTGDEGGAAVAALEPQRERAGEARSAVEAGELTGLGERLASIDSELAAAEVSAERARLLIHVARTTALLADATEGGDSSALSLRAAERFARAEEWAREAEDPRLESYALGYRGGLYEAAGRHEEALALTQRAAFAAGTANSTDARYRWAWQLGRIHRAMGDDAGAITFYQQAVNALEGVSSLLATPDAAASFRSEVAPVYDGLVDLLLRKAAPLTATEARSVLLHRARNTLESLRVAELRDYFQDECLVQETPTSPDDVPGAVVIYPVMLPDRLELLVSRGGDIRSYRVEVGAETLAARARDFRNLLEKRTTYQFRRPAADFYDWLIRPIEPSLANPEEIEALVFISAGPLRGIPMAALWDKEEKRYLVERLPLASSPASP